MPAHPCSAGSDAGCCAAMHTRLLRLLATTLLLCGLGLLVSASVGAVPPPKFWTASRCEHVLLGNYGAPTGSTLPNGTGHNFHIGQVTCVESGGPDACRWTSGHLSRLYSQFTVFARSPRNGGVVRSWTLATRAGHGLVPVAHRAIPFLPDFYMSRTKLLTTGVTPARFRSIVAPLAARITQRENATGCTGQLALR